MRQHPSDGQTIRSFRATSLALAILALAGCRDDAVGPSLAPEVTAAVVPGVQSYSYVTIADTRRDNFNPFEFGCAAVNDAGAVAFRGKKNSGATGIYRGAGGAPTVIVQDNFVKYNFLGFNPSINNAGDVSFGADLRPGGEAILRGRGGPLTTIATTKAGVYNFFAFDTSINDSGTVAFAGELANFDEGVFFGAGAGVTTVYLATSSQFQGSASGPAINNTRQVAFSEDLDAGGSGIFRWNGGTFTTIATTAGPIGIFPWPPSLNNKGAVAFGAFLDSGAEAIMKGSGGALTTVASSTGPFRDFAFDGPSINDAGRVAFAGTLDAGGDGIFVTPNPIANRVIKTGDPLGGSTVSSVVLCREGLNASGQVAFQAQLSDGRALIVRATPSAS